MNIPQFHNCLIFEFNLIESNDNRHKSKLRILFFK